MPSADRELLDDETHQPQHLLTASQHLATLTDKGNCYRDTLASARVACNDLVTSPQRAKIKGACMHGAETRISLSLD